MGIHAQRGYWLRCGVVLCLVFFLHACGLLDGSPEPQQITPSEEAMQNADETSNYNIEYRRKMNLLSDQSPPPRKKKSIVPAPAKSPSATPPTAIPPTANAPNQSSPMPPIIHKQGKYDSVHLNWASESNVALFTHSQNIFVAWAEHTDKAKDKSHLFIQAIDPVQGTPLAKPIQVRKTSGEVQRIRALTTGDGNILLGWCSATQKETAVYGAIWMDKNGKRQGPAQHLGVVSLKGDRNWSLPCYFDLARYKTGGVVVRQDGAQKRADCDAPDCDPELGPDYSMDLQQAIYELAPNEPARLKKINWAPHFDLPGPVVSVKSEYAAVEEFTRNPSIHFEVHSSIQFMHSPKVLAWTGKQLILVDKDYKNPTEYTVGLWNDGILEVPDLPPEYYDQVGDDALIYLVSVKSEKIRCVGNRPAVVLQTAKDKVVVVQETKDSSIPWAKLLAFLHLGKYDDVLVHQNSLIAIDGKKVERYTCAEDGFLGLQNSFNVN